VMLQHMQGDDPHSDAPRSMPSAYLSQPTPLPQTTMLQGDGQDNQREWRLWLHLRVERGEESRCAVNILCFLDRRGRVLRDKFFEFIPMSVFEVEGCGSSVVVVNGSKFEIDVNGNVVGAQTREDHHSHKKAK